jgi:hypothetical protein
VVGAAGASLSTGQEDAMDDMGRRFDYHEVGLPAGAQMELLRRKVKELGTEMTGVLPEGREKSLALTKLEEALFWANAAISRG